MTAPLMCPECGAPMELRPSRFGQFWGCTRYRATGCKGSHGAHPDGSPLGIPANAATKAARVRAHAAFDLLWKEKHVDSRKAAYRWMQERLELSPEQAHIGSFSIEQCEALIVAVEQMQKAAI